MNPACTWCGREMGARPEKGRSMLLDDLCLECGSTKWKRFQPLAIWIEHLAYDLGVLREKQ